MATYIKNYINGTSLNEALYGTALDDVMNGSIGAHVMYGSLGADTYIVDGDDQVLVDPLTGTDDGIDTIQSSATWNLSAGGANANAYIENLTLTGSAAINATGNALNNVLHGDTNSAANVLAGGAGDDTYWVGAGDTVVENAGEGTDTVYSTAGSFTLGANIENLNLGGYSATGIGNDLNNIINGTAGSDVLNGLGGADTMNGGLGNDTYYVDNAGDVVQDMPTSVRGSGTDTVIASVNYVLSNTSGVENLTMMAGAGNINGTSNDLNNTLTGNEGSNVLTGGLGNDTYVVSTGDVVVESGGTAGGIDTIVTDVASLADLSATSVENVTLTGSAAIAAFGNADANILRGDGNTAANALAGGAGNDTYYLGAGDTVVENAGGGIDTVYRASSGNALDANVENLVLTSAGQAIGNSADNTITGTVGNDIINGGAGADTMVGSLGNDTYFVDNVGDVVQEIATTLMGNNDTIYVDSNGTGFSAGYNYVLASNVENLILTGTNAINGVGNDSNNLLSGNSAANTLTGGAGNDTYVVSTGDTVVELAGQGTDTIKSDVSWDLSSGGANANAYVENITLTGTGNATGNDLNNVLRGDTSSAANVLAGGLGNDTYYVGNGDSVVDTGGTDTVVASISYTLGLDVENLTLSGNVGLFGIGNAGDNVITGGYGSDYLSGGLGNDRLIGGLGNDVLYGGAGNDTFVFNSNNFSTVNRDFIADFTSGSDKIELSKAAFGSLASNTSGTLSSTDFTSGAGLTSGNATGAGNSHFILDTTNGLLYYDADGSGAGAGVSFAQLSIGATLASTDFTVV